MKLSSEQRLSLACIIALVLTSALMSLPQVHQFAVNLADFTRLVNSLSDAKTGMDMHRDYTDQMLGVYAFIALATFPILTTLINWTLPKWSSR